MALRGGEELPYLGYMLTYRADGAQQFAFRALEFLAPVLQLEWVHRIHPAWIEWFEA